MNDNISRQWLMECVNEGWVKFDTEKDENRFIHLVRDIAPSAEPEIIHCRDCEFTDGDGPIADGRYWCVLHESFMYFCSDAKRRTDG